MNNFWTEKTNKVMVRFDDDEPILFTTGLDSVDFVATDQQRLRLMDKRSSKYIDIYIENNNLWWEFDDGTHDHCPTTIEIGPGGEKISHLIVTPDTSYEFTTNDRAFTVWIEQEYKFKW